MPSIQSPTVFVSSTCYDLGEVRDRLKSFIEDFGFDPMLSEFDSFPVNPLQDTIDNCRKNVEERADMLILIVGNRYGSTNETGTSITNLKYLQARAKGIPIYVFIKRTVLELLPVWKENPDATFSGVDSPRLFSFVDSLRNLDGLWSYSFDKAEDIIATLRTQWAYLFLSSLRIWMKARDAGLSDSLRQLNGDALQLLIEKPSYWEYRLYANFLKNRLAALADAKRDWDLGISYGNYEHVEPEQTLTWLTGHQQEMMTKVQAVSTLFRPDVMEDAFGASGESGTPEKIIYLADRLAELYGEMLQWSMRCRNVLGDKSYSRLLEITSRGVSNAITEIEEFSKKLNIEMSKLVNNPPCHGETRHVEISLALTYPEGLEKEQARELQRLAREFGIST